MDRLCQKKRLKHYQAWIPIKENPSDLRTGVKVERLTKFWYEGPSWLGKEEDWPTTEGIYNLSARANIINSFRNQGYTNGNIQN